MYEALAGLDGQQRLARGGVVVVAGKPPPQPGLQPRVGPADGGQQTPAT